MPVPRSFLDNPATASALSRECPVCGAPKGLACYMRRAGNSVETVVFCTPRINNELPVASFTRTVETHRQS